MAQLSDYGEWLTVTIASGGTSTDAINIGRSYDYLQIILPTLTSGTLKLQVCDTYSGTYIDLMDGETTATTTGLYADLWLLGGYQYCKVVSSAAQGSARSIKVRGMNKFGE